MMMMMIMIMMMSSSSNSNNNIGNLYCAVPILIYSTAHYNTHLHIITPALAELPIGAQKHYKEWIPAGYPFTTPGSRETIADKMPCLRAYAPSGILTHDPLITSREHEPLHYSAPSGPRHNVRTLGSIKWPCYIRFLIISGLKTKKQRARTSRIPFPQEGLLYLTTL